MTTLAVRLGPFLLIGALVAGCASRGGVPRPRPFPGAPVPPAETNAAPDPTLAPSLLLATALSLLGIPYLNGGTDPARGFDCSGFVQWVFGQHGVPLPRDTRAQYEEGVKVDRQWIQPGDLVFFQTVARGPSHVGIALGGDEFVHAPSSRGVVRVEQYTNSYWRERWVGARRVATVAASSD